MSDRLFIGLITLALITSIYGFTWTQTTKPTNTQFEARHVTVQPNDTLWDIAAREYPGDHTGRRVYEIRQANPEIGRDCVIRPGQKVRIPF